MEENVQAGAGAPEQSGVTEPETNSAVEAAEIPEEPEPAEPRRHSIAEWTVTLILLLFATTTLTQSFVIPTVSMEDTLLAGDHLLVDKLAYAPSGLVSKYLLPYEHVRRGDIIAFRWPGDIRQNFVKRVIGVPGDRLRLVSKVLYLNGKPVSEPYKSMKTPYFDSYRDNFPGMPNVPLADAAVGMLTENVRDGELTVPPGNYFVMGDNRDNSLDSRYWGFVPRANIIGKPLVIYWSYDAPADQLANPNILSLAHVKDLAKNFFSKTRWSRTFRFVRGYPLK
jgi:signal peptidase I